MYPGAGQYQYKIHTNDGPKIEMHKKLSIDYEKKKGVPGPGNYNL